ncbi:hypothetical protein H0H93_015716 [Arthromyces matolae]|nr:hypothetical protein H0H93_015716 [Arthromyces matolae]
MARRPVPCNCTRCKGALVPPSTRTSHQAQDLKNQFITTTQAQMQPLRRRESRAQTTKAKTRTSREQLSLPATSAPLDQGGLCSTERGLEDGSCVGNYPFTFEFPSSAAKTSSTPLLNSSAPPSPILSPSPLLSPVTTNTELMEAEARGCAAMSAALEESFQELASLGPVVLDDWDEDADEGEGEDDNGEDAIDQPEVQPQDRTSNDLCRGDTSSRIPVAASVTDENTPDPFFHISSIRDPAQPAANSLHLHPAIRLLYILVAWLHTHFHLPFAACYAILTVVTFCFALLCPGFPSGATYKTLPSVLNHLNIEPEFRILPMCPQCLNVYPCQPEIVSCATCNVPLYKSSSRSTPSLQTPGRSTRQPILQFPTKSIQEQLESILAVDGIEDVLEQWRHLPRISGEYIDNFDGEICKTVPGPNGRPFFENPAPRETQEELRIGLTLGVDWCGHSVFISSQQYSAFPFISPHVVQHHKLTTLSQISHKQLDTRRHSSRTQRADW